MKDLSVIYAAMGKRVDDAIQYVAQLETERDTLKENVSRLSLQVKNLNDMLKESEKKRITLQSEIDSLTTIKNYIKRFKGGRK